jgi:primosomal protein N' (replication factor Y)
MANTCRVLVPLPPLRALSTHVYDYLAPPAMAVAPGDYVSVGFGREKVVGVVWDAPPDANVPASKLKPLAQRLDIPRMAPALMAFIDWMARYTLTPHGAVLKMVLAGTGALQMPLKRAARVLRTEDHASPLVPELSSAQQAAAQQLVTKVNSGFSVTLLDGVTGSGKTEVYCAAIETALQGGQVLVLLPEIALSTQLLQRLQIRFGFVPTEWHSGLTPAQRRRNWHAIVNGQARLIVGARSALLLPYQRLSLIVVDEEHEHSFKQEEGVVYQARDMAVARAQHEKIPIILSTATPSLETWGNVQAGRYECVTLPARYGGAQLPTVQLIDTRIDKPARQSWLSPTLIAALREQQEKGEQSLLYLNRRGYAPLTLCRQCGHRFQCPQCSTWLVSHDGNTRLMCHHCGYGQSMPDACPACHTAGELAACGPGVERIEDEVKALFPTARRAVLTSDRPEDPKDVRALIDDMADGRIDILIGTQMVTKGYNFPNLTLVGVLDADLGLAGGDLRAAERTFQMLTQVAGRAGRAAKSGRVLLQTTDPQQPLMRVLARSVVSGAVTDGRDAFLAEQLGERELFGMPPYGRLAAVIVSGTDIGMVDRACRTLAQTQPHEAGVVVYGPAPAPIARLRGKYRNRFLVKGSKDIKLQPLLRDWLQRADVPRTVKVSVDIDPYSFL